MANNWTIQNDPPPNNAEGDELDGLEIAAISGGAGGYSLIDQFSVQVGSTTKTSPPFTFVKVPFAQQTWNIHVTKLPAEGNGKGKWTLLGGSRFEDTGNQDGDFTAQAGSGVDDDPKKAKDPGKAASSGKAY